MKKNAQPVINTNNDAGIEIMEPGQYDWPQGRGGGRSGSKYKLDQLVKPGQAVIVPAMARGGAVWWGKKRGLRFESRVIDNDRAIVRFVGPLEPAPNTNRTATQSRMARPARR